MPLTTPLNHDITKAAAGYSQLSGIMAGFSFAVLVWVVERLNTRDDNLQEDILVIRALVYLGITFLGNLVDSFFWALLSGVQSLDSPQVGILAHISAWQMAQLAPLTMQAMTLVVSTAGSRYAVTLFRRLFFVTALIGAAFTWTHTYAVIQRYSASPAMMPYMPVCVALFAALLLGGFLLSGRPSGQRFGADTEASFSRFVSISLVGTLLAGVAFAWATISPSGIPVSQGAIAIANLLWAALVAWSCAYLPD
ncbi:MAG: hypothetical protein SFU56_13995 [Capsulimonadales bacterium]|nr:hypothetical protein [Capsulimonadales bacterium]